MKPEIQLFWFGLQVMYTADMTYIHTDIRYKCEKGVPFIISLQLHKSICTVHMYSIVQFIKTKHAIFNWMTGNWCPTKVPCLYNLFSSGHGNRSTETTK